MCYPSQSFDLFTLENMQLSDAVGVKCNMLLAKTIFLETMSGGCRLPHLVNNCRPAYQTLKRSNLLHLQHIVQLFIQCIF